MVINTWVFHTLSSKLPFPDLLTGPWDTCFEAKTRYCFEAMSGVRSYYKIFAEVLVCAGTFSMDDNVVCFDVVSDI